MRITRARIVACSTGLLLACGQRGLGGVTLGQTDTFQDGTTNGWQQGGVSPNQPTNTPSGGPNGSGDMYLSVISSGAFGAGGKLVVFNTQQWTGDFFTPGVTRVDAEMDNLGSTPLFMRVALRDAAGSEYSSTNSVMLGAGSGWTAVSFDLTSSGLSRVSGADSLSTTLSSVNEFRFLSAQFGPAFNGDTMAATLGLDDVHAASAAPPPPLPGDADRDGKVDLNDLLILAHHYGASNATFDVGDFNGDGVVNFADLMILGRNFGTTSGSPAVSPIAPAFVSPAVDASIGQVPEPAIAGPAAVGAISLLPRRRARARACVRARHRPAWVRTLHGFAIL